ncbi:chorismate--pyruvate lyase [Pseudomonas floridensis]|uniref:Probable chorismate pyruvate-lyase n=1 Tax=Pseudomonas floridensis TaxID=1958950 RepID=A0A1X0N7S7_9PSED|nr:chorismate lyase [Pseudomonas floridensis]ORC59015.1 chorismate--pyruvate lyase [Pseudomonas floridensis]
MTQQNPAFTTPVWLERDRLIDAPEPVILDWLFNQDSLTRRLDRLSDGGFSVIPLFEGWQPLRDDECVALALPKASEGWVREVYLLGNGNRWVFARSVADRSALSKGGLQMDALGSRSLGELLFSDPAFDRGQLEVCRYPENRLPPADSTEGLWARRSRFSRGPLSVLVAEVFLPSFMSVIQKEEQA